jgi:hypothetical protein
MRRAIDVPTPHPNPSFTLCQIPPCCGAVTGCVGYVGFDIVYEGRDELYDELLGYDEPFERIGVEERDTGISLFLKKQNSFTSWNIKNDSVIFYVANYQK